MPIIQNTKSTGNLYDVYSVYPDQYLSDKEKQGDDWIKASMDYWYTKGLSHCTSKKKRIVSNYKLLNGFLSSEDFYQEYKNTVVDEAASLLDALESDIGLPASVKHYSILSNPINTLCGEMTKRPDNAHVIAVDDESMGEKMQALSDMFTQFATQEIRKKIMTKLASQGVDVSAMEQAEEEIQQLTTEELAHHSQHISIEAEKWGQAMLKALKANFNIKEKSEEAFRDMLICSEQYFHIYQDGSKLGIACDVENPKNVWKFMTDNKRYTRDAYAAGTVHIMEFSELIYKYPFLTKEEIDHLKKQAQTQSDPILYDSPLVRNQGTGANTIKFHKFDPVLHEERMRQEAMMMNNELDIFMETGLDLSSYANMFVVTKAYWSSKKKMGKLSYLDEQGEIQTTLVDENYKKIPEQVNIEWGYINQWYEGLKIGNDVYYVNPLEILDYCPIIGVEFGNKNSPAASLIDLMKPFQMIFNVCMNQLWEELSEEMGKIPLISKRHIPGSKGGDNQDAIDEWMMEARNMGVMFIDDSVENTKVPSAFNQYTTLDLTKSQQMQTRMNMAEWAKNMCHELVGISRQRAASTTASETATAIDTAMQQSYAQTENYFMQHEYLCQQLYQAMLDAAQYIETQKPESTIQNITDGSWAKFSRGDINLRDIQVFIQNRGREAKAFQDMQSLIQPMLQNGADLTVVADMFTLDSVRQLKENIQAFQKKKDELVQQQQQQKQQELDQQQQQFEAQMQQAQAEKQAAIENENYNKELDRINKKEVAIISALGFGKQSGEDADGNGTPDIYQTEQLMQGQQKIQQAHQIALQKQQLADKQHLADNALQQQHIELQKEKLKVEKDKIESQERIAKQRQNSKPAKK